MNSYADNVQQNLNEADALRQRGNLLMAEKEYAAAIKAYSKIPLYVDGCTMPPNLSGTMAMMPPGQGNDRELHQELVDRVLEARVSAQLNLSLAHSRLQNWSVACLHASKAIDLAPDRAKGWFRRGAAKLELNDFDDALADLKRANELAPNDAAIKQQLLILKQRRAAYMNRVQQRMSQNFQNMNLS